MGQRKGGTRRGALVFGTLGVPSVKLSRNGPYKETLVSGVIYLTMSNDVMRSRSSVVSGFMPYLTGPGFKPRLVHVLRSNAEKRLKTGKNRYFFPVLVTFILKIALNTGAVSL